MPFKCRGRIVFVRLPTEGCWALTADHRVVYIHRRQSRRCITLDHGYCHDDQAVTVVAKRDTNRSR